MCSCVLGSEDTDLVLPSQDLEPSPEVVDIQHAVESVACIYKRIVRIKSDNWIRSIV